MSKFEGSLWVENIVFLVSLLKHVKWVSFSPCQAWLLTLQCFIRAEVHTK